MKLDIAADFLRTERVEQYFGPLAIARDHLHGIASSLPKDASGYLGHVQAGLDLGQDFTEPVARIEADGVGIVELRGPLAKYGSSMSAAGSSLKVRRLIQKWRDDPAVKGLLLVIDSPGGTVAGTEDLAAAIRSFAAVKPSVAVIEDLGASAAYWVACSAGKVYANRSALVGSIGAYCVLVDSSKAAEQAGLTVHVVRSADGKGAGEDGTAILPEQLADAQRTIDGMHALFVADVARGRKLQPADAAAVADGRVYGADEALAMKLIDGIATADEARQRVLGSVVPTGNSTNEGTQAMARRSTAKAGIKAEDKPLDGEKPKVKGKKAISPAAPVMPPVEDEDEEKVEDLPLEDEDADPVDPAELPVDPEDLEEAAEDLEDAAEDAEDDEDEEDVPAAKKAKAATVKQLKAALPNATAEFRETCLEKGLSLTASLKAYVAEVDKRQPARKSVQPLPTRFGSAAAGTPKSAFEARVDALIAKGQSRSAATRAVVASHPALHAEFLAAVNRGR